MEILFWLLVTICFYTYIGYPLILFIVTNFFINKDIENNETEKSLPLVSIIIPAYNEEHAIREKIENVFNLDYPKDILHIVVCSDGSTDNTNSIISCYHDKKNIDIRIFPKNIGKINILNTVIATLKADVIIFSDATAMIKQDAISLLCKYFNDPKVGCVSAGYKVIDINSSSTGQEESTYWRYESWIKSMESVLGIVIGCHGSLYAIRRQLYPYPQSNTINDDYVISALIASKGYKIKYEPKAIAFEQAVEMQGFTRRVRIAIGNYQQIKVIKCFFSSGNILAIWHLFSHKFLRLIVPECLLVIFILSFFLVEPLYKFMLLGQILFYTLAIFKILLDRFKVKLPFLGLAYYFCAINLAIIAGGIYIIFNRKNIKWRKSI